MRLSRVETRHLFLGCILLIALYPAVGPVADPDFFWHIKVGEWIVNHGAVPTRDLFTYTVSSHAFVAHEWLSEVIMWLITNGLGLTAVSIYFGLVTWIGFACLLLTMRNVGFVFAGLSLVLAYVVGSPIWGPRTQMLTFTLVIVLLLLLRRYRETGSRRWLYPLPPMFIVWVNLHAGFTLGLLLLATVIVGELISARVDGGGAPLKPLLAVFALSALAVVVNPNFAAIYVYAAQTQFSPAQQQFIVEWLSPNFHDSNVRPYELALILLLTLLILVRRRPRATDLLLVLGGVVLSLQSVRHIALFVAFTTPVLAEQLQAGWDQLPSKPSFRLPRTSTAMGAINLAVILAVGVGVSAAAVGRAHSDFKSPAVVADYPVKAVDALAGDLPPGNMYNQYGWGGYLVYRLWPQRRVFIYGDAAVMGDPFLKEYEHIQDLGPRYLEALQRRGVSWVIFHTDSPLPAVLSNDPGWAVVYRDKEATVLVRRGPNTDAYIARHGSPA